MTENQRAEARPLMTPNYIAKIEGHGEIQLDIEKNTARLVIHEGERLFEGMIVQKRHDETYWITPRICGVCPIAHNLACLAAVENAFGVSLSPSSTALRRILLAAQNIQSHVLHLYFLSLPEYLGVDSGVEISKTHPVHFKAAVALRAFSDMVAETIGGRAVHPITPTTGGFHKYPSQDVLKMIKKETAKVKKLGEHTYNLAAGITYPDLRRGTEYFTTVGDDENYPMTNTSRVISTKGLSQSIQEYNSLIKERVKDYSTAKFSEHNGRGFMVGSLARFKNAHDRLLGPAREMYDKNKELFSHHNSFLNNLAQAIELNHFIAEIDKQLDFLLKEGVDEKIADFQPKESRAVGAAEVPRGTLYYELAFDNDGRVTYANIITPTAQNLTNIEEDANEILKTIGKDKSPEEKNDLIEKLIRAYDPCLSCSVH